MLNSFTKHGFFDITVKAEGDLEIDAHHTIEDLGLVLGQAVREALGSKSGISRFGSAFVPMDDALTRVVIDISGRPFLAYNVPSTASEAGGINVRLFREFFQAVSTAAGLTIHVSLLSGEEVHHIMESVFKAFGKALDQATGIDSRQKGVPSTKGMLA